MKKLKVMTVVGTRPEIIRLSAVIKELRKFCNHTLLHTGQNYDYELNEIFFNDLGLKVPDVYLNVESASSIDSIGKIISAVEPHLIRLKPDAFLVLGDTNSCLSAIAAKRLRIPVFHMEAGNRCFDQRVPEEINRKIVDSVADINLPYSDISREYLIREGFPPDRVIKTGSPMFEVIYQNIEKIKASCILKNLNLKDKDYFLVSCHREENVDSEKMLNKLIQSLNLIADTYKKTILFSLHPRTKKRIAASRKKLSKHVVMHKPFGYSDYVSLQLNAIATLSDSGTINEEASILNFPAINIREAHERPEGMEEAAVMMTGLNPSRIMQSIKILSRQSRETNARDIFTPRDYQQNNVSKKVLRIIHSYVDYINNKIWFKDS